MSRAWLLPPLRGAPRSRPVARSGSSWPRVAPQVKGWTTAYHVDVRASPGSGGCAGCEGAGGIREPFFNKPGQGAGTEPLHDVEGRRTGCCAVVRFRADCGREGELREGQVQRQVQLLPAASRLPEGGDRSVTPAGEGEGASLDIAPHGGDHPATHLYLAESR